MPFKVFYQEPTWVEVLGDFTDEEFQQLQRALYDRPISRRVLFDLRGLKSAPQSLTTTLALNWWHEVQVVLYDDPGLLFQMQMTADLLDVPIRFLTSLDEAFASSDEGPHHAY
jgi:hypothetical protein